MTKQEKSKKKKQHQEQTKRAKYKPEIICGIRNQILERHNRKSGQGNRGKQGQNRTDETVKEQGDDKDLNTRVVDS